ncbi:MAG: hypothetical protein DRP45_12060 [Candidatus Zixiibacteriota bacterium]|nr:MAG: hypothetical protein DRP45_12060 [candidate division Zixibacteria bacterium]
MSEVFTRKVDGVEQVWDVATLRQLSRDLPVNQEPIELFHSSIETTPWDDGWTCAKVAYEQAGPHWRPHADLTDPLLIDPEGWVADGNHRLARHLAEGHTVVPVVWFETWEAMKLARIINAD